MVERRQELVCEIVGDEPYEYYPIGDHVVRAPGISDGEPTFKYTRIGIGHAQALLSSGWSVEEVAEAYKLPVAAVEEAKRLVRHDLAHAG